MAGRAATGLAMPTGTFVPWEVVLSPRGRVNYLRSEPSRRVQRSDSALQVQPIDDLTRSKPPPRLLLRVHWEVGAMASGPPQDICRGRGGHESEARPPADTVLNMQIYQFCNIW